MTDAEVTLDRPAPGVVICQPRRGFRYGAEAFWLVGFALEGGVPRTAADLGTGSGVIAALLAARGVHVVGYELRAEWQPHWARTLAASRLTGRLELRTADVASGIDGPVDLVVSNPPFFRTAQGPSAPGALRAAARTESTAALSTFVRVGLAEAPRLCVVVPVEREAELGELAVVRRAVRVGRRRLLAELVRFGVPGEVSQVDEGDPRVAGWYSLARNPGDDGVR